MPSFVRDLTDRKVVQWGVAYLAAAWLVLQVVDVLADVWSLSLLLQRAIQVFLVAGLAVTLVLAWYHGERGRQRASGPELLIIAGVLGIAAILTGVLARDDGVVSRPDTGPRAGVGGDASAGRTSGAASADPTPVAGSAAAARIPARLAARDPALPSIAVLPFADMSRGGDQGYFADGIAEEILTGLARLPGLKVAGRTSSFGFRGRAVDIPTIGARLGVGNVLEGSVRMEGDSVRITVQLVSVEDGFHLWSGEYDRELAGVFAIQEDIAREVVEALQVELGDRRVEEAWSSRTSPAAYGAYLRGRQALSELTPTGWRRALEQFSASLALDSTFAPAWSGSGAARFALWYFGLEPLDDVVPLAREEARRALELDHALGEPHAVLALIALYVDRDWTEAERQVVRALELDPGDVFARHAYGDLLTILGDPEAGLRQVELGRDADPLSFLASAPAAAHLLFAGRFEEAIDAFGTLWERFPEQRGVGRDFLALGLWHLGRFDEAWDEYRRAWADDPALGRAVERAIAAEGNRAGMRAWADVLAGRYEPGGAGALEIAHLYARAEAWDEAFRWLDRSLAERPPGLLHVTRHPDFAPVRDDPRFRRFLDRLGIPRPEG